MNVTLTVIRPITISCVPSLPFTNPLQWLHEVKCPSYVQFRISPEVVGQPSTFCQLLKESCEFRHTTCHIGLLFLPTMWFGSMSFWMQHLISQFRMIAFQEKGWLPLIYPHFFNTSTDMAIFTLKCAKLPVPAASSYFSCTK